MNLVVPEEVGIAVWWARTYDQICKDLGFSPKEDHEAALLLSDLLGARKRHPLQIRDMRIDGPAVVAGAADTLQDELAKRGPRPAELVIAADGAVAGLLEVGVHPHLIVSDLDGDLETLDRLNTAGIAVAVHAHGDNQDRLHTWVPRLQGPLLGTRQTPGPAPSDIVSPGGLGDGDRAVFLAARLGATRIRLVGFDLHGEPGRLSPGRDPERKRAKMEWSARILSDAHRLGLPLEETEGKGVERVH